MAQPEIGAPPDTLPSIRLLVSDVDGTLVRPDKRISPATIQAVQRLRAAGIRFTLVSSRPPLGLLPLVQTLGIDVATAAFNGGAIVDTHGQVVESHPLSPRDAQTTLAMLATYDVETWVFADGLWLLQDPHGPYVPLERMTLGYDGTVVGSFEPYLDRIEKIVAASADADGLVRLEQELNPRISPTAQAVRSQAYYLDVNHARANKGDAVAALARHIGVPLENTAVIGDGANDVPMFERAGLSIAMGQADAAVRGAAMRVTASNADDGLAAAVERYLLPGAKP
jgi:Cof subfamily protein (haloacid dehalogenase superfamily)